MLELCFTVHLYNIDKSSFLLVKKLSQIKGYHSVELLQTASGIAGCTKKTLVHFSYDSIKSIDAMELKFSAIKVNIFWSKCAKNQVNTFYGSLVINYRIGMLFSGV